MSKIYKLMFGLLLSATMLFAQSYTVSGVISEAGSGNVLIGANVYLEGTPYGAASDANGKYEFTAPAGNYTLVCSYIGFKKATKDISLTEDIVNNFALEDYEFSLSVEVIANRARERETPVAYTDISKKEMQTQLGSRDIPLILNTTPSVFATNQGGGAGDARINVRGFDQENIAIMINGVPINDMENGWVYWSNWDGLGDATSSIQMQRGLSAVNLATPSIGGSMNVITDPTSLEPGIFMKQETGTANFSKSTVFANTGLINDKYALSLGLVKKTGDGIAEKVWTDAWAYYLGASYQINSNNRIELYAMGAPQRHGQRSYALNAANYSHELARDLGYSETALRDPKLQEQGINYNPNWNTITTEYQGDQYYKEYWNTPFSPRHDPTYINERENYYHKPIVNLNWYTRLSERFSIYTTAYWSGGEGGGSGTLGSIKYNTSLLQRVVDFNATYEQNINNEQNLDFDGDGDSSSYKVSEGILRNSVNSQWTIGAISKAYYKFSDEFTGSFGIDLRHAKIDHYREVRDLLGGNYYYDDANMFEGEMAHYKYLGDKLDYYNTNTVDWIGVFVQGEYSQAQWTLYGTAGYTMIKYDFVDHFNAVNDNPARGELSISPDWFNGFQLKGGASYRISPSVDVYANAGYVKKVPIFDQVIDDNTATEIKDYKSENFMSGELGLNAMALDNKLNIKTNLYYTAWSDRGVTEGFQNSDGSEGLIRIGGMDETHMGIELEATFQPIRFFRLDLAAAKGFWEYTNDVSAIYVADIGSGTQDTLNLYLDGLKVGDQPQTQLAVTASIYPMRGLLAQLIWQFNTEYYAGYDPLDRDDSSDRAQVWEIPSYHLFDLHVSYSMDVNLVGLKEVTVFGHVFNLFDALYVQDATDNSSYNAYSANGKNHSADDAEVFPGAPRNFNAGFSIRF